MVLRSVGALRAVAVAAIALSAWLHARGISALVGERLEVCGAPRPLAAAAPSPPEPPRSADAILARNPFDSTTGSLLPRSVDDGPAGQPPTAAGLSGCHDVHVLAIAAEADPTRSLALLRIDGEPEPRLRGVGGEVVTIDPLGVLLDRAGTRCVAWIFSRPGPAPVGAPQPPPAHGIASTGPTSFAVDRATRDALLDGAGDWMKTVSIRPEKVGDDVVGIRMLVVKPGSPLDSLGIRSGDVLQSVNGFPLTTPEKLLEALGRLRTAEHLSLAIERGGHGLQVDYDVR